jgi:cystine transport system substrate-binding protein
MRHALKGVVLLLLLVLLVPAQASAAPADNSAQPVVRVGTEGTHPPFSFHDPRTADLTGYDIEVVKAIAEKAGWRLEFVETQWDAIFPALDARRIDVIANQVSVNDGGVIVEKGPSAQVIGDLTEERTRRFLKRVLDPG